MLSFLSAYFLLQGNMLFTIILAATSLILSSYSSIKQRKIIIYDLIQLFISVIVFVIPILFITNWSEIDNILLKLWALSFNSIGKLYYLSVSSHVIILIGILLIISILIRKYDFKFLKIIKSDIGFLFFLVLLLFIGTLIVTNYTSIINLNNYRFDRFFYGRYIVTSTVPLFAIGLFYLTKLKRKGLLSFIFLGGFSFLIMFYFITEQYALSFMGDSVSINFIYFFPFVVSLGEHNMIVLSVYTLGLSIPMIFMFRKNKVIAAVIWLLIYLFITVFSHYYLSYYSTTFIKQRMKITAFAKEFFPNDTVYCDKRLGPSQEQIRMQYVIPWLRVEYFHPKKSPEGKFIIARDDYSRFNKKARLLMKEFDSRESMWIIPDSNDRFKPFIVDYSYLNIADDRYIGIQKRNKINKRGVQVRNYKYPVKNTSNIKRFVIRGNNHIRNNFIRVTIDGISIHGILKKTGNFSLSLKLQDLYKIRKSIVKRKKYLKLKKSFKTKGVSNIKLFGRGKHNNFLRNPLINIEIISKTKKIDSITKGMEITEMYFDGIVDQKYAVTQLENPIYPELQIFPAFNVFSQDYSANDTLTIPYVLIEDSKYPLDRKKHYLVATWHEYKLKREVSSKKHLLSDIEMNSRKDILLLPVVTPEIPARYFLYLKIVDEQGNEVPSFSRFIDLILKQEKDQIY
jgi:hypothetical protein